MMSSGQTKVFGQSPNKQHLPNSSAFSILLPHSSPNTGEKKVVFPFDQNCPTLSHCRDPSRVNVRHQRKWENTTSDWYNIQVTVHANQTRGWHSKENQISDLLPRQSPIPVFLYEQETPQQLASTCWPRVSHFLLFTSADPGETDLTHRPWAKGQSEEIPERLSLVCFLIRQGLCVLRSPDTEGRGLSRGACSCQSRPAVWRTSHVDVLNVNVSFLRFPQICSSYRLTFDWHPHAGEGLEISEWISCQSFKDTPPPNPLPTWNKWPFLGKKQAIMQNPPKTIAMGKMRSPKRKPKTWLEFQISRQSGAFHLPWGKMEQWARRRKGLLRFPPHRLETLEREIWLGRNPEKVTYK